MTFAASAEPAQRRARAGVVHLLLVASGLAGLGYQLVWTRMLAIGLGHEAFAVLAVVTAFFLGLAAGALLLDRRIAESRRPGLWYAGLEALIGVWALALIWLIPITNAWVADWIGPEPTELRRWAGAFLGPALLLLPATVAMGATLPAAERLYARIRRNGRGIGGLYAANAVGAMLGVGLSALVLMPALGFSATLAVFAGINLTAAALTLLGPARGEGARPPLPAAQAGAGPTPGLLAALAATGLLGLGLEVAAIRALSQVLENTVYSFAAALAIYLLGTTAGAALYQAVYAPRRGPGWDRPALAWLGALTAASAAVAALAASALPEIHRAIRSALGTPAEAAMLAETLAAAAILLVPTAAMGALFSHLAQAARGPRGGLGAALAANTLGAAAAPPLLGVVAIPSLGTVGAVAAVAAGYVALALVLARPRPLQALALVGAAAALLHLALTPEARRLYRAAPGVEIRASVDGRAATATVTEEPSGHRWLTVNGGLVMGGTRSDALDRIQGHFALLRHPAPRRALFLGVGTGATLAAAAAYPELEATGVELLPEVLEVVPEFERVAADLAGAEGRVRLLEGDARRYVRAARGTYDVIVADTYHPARDGAGLLYTVEHFRAIEAALAADGVFVQWLPLHQLDLETLRLILRSFLAVFPDARLSMGNFNLGTPLLAVEARRGGGAAKLSEIVGRPIAPALGRELAEIGLATPFALFGGFLAGPEALRRFAGAGPLNTDDHPRVLFAAPRSVYGPTERPVARLFTLVRTFGPRAYQAVSLQGSEVAEIFPPRLEAYWAARNNFLFLGARTGPTGNPVADAQRLAPRLLAILEESPDFGPAYDPVLAMARAVAPQDPAVARRLLGALATIAPQRPEARRALERLRSLRLRRGTGRAPSPPRPRTSCRARAARARPSHASRGAPRSRR